ncbi:MAG TPA: NADH-quinone oxidoreductase subunit N, partial [Acetobacteraceae bacterium]|nr:NADH-quinone oxidoreductase subunit N [Acetobacteraceae bacterium]
AAVQGGFWVLATIGVLTSVVSAYYYLRIVKAMYFDQGTGAALDRAPASLSVVMAGSGLFNMFFILWPTPMLGAAGAAAAALLG